MYASCQPSVNSNSSQEDQITVMTLPWVVVICSLSPVLQRRSSAPAVVSHTGPRILEVMRPRALELETVAAREEATAGGLPPDEPPPGARPHQRAAIVAMRRHFASGDGGTAHGGGGGPVAATDGVEVAAPASRATIVLPPGTGKTLVGMWALESEAAVDSIGVVVVPTLPLIDQTLAAYRSFSPAIGNGLVAVLAVGSDCADAFVAHTCDPDEIAAFLARHAGERRLILSTYDSLPALAKGAATAGAHIGLAVFDEAHYMAGTGPKFAFGLDDAKLPLRRRLFLTGTPRVFAERSPAAFDTDGDAGVAPSSTAAARSMHDVHLFGPVVYRLSFRQAVDAGLIVDLKVLLVNVSATYAQLCERTPELSVAVAERSVPLERAELTVAVADAMHERDLSKAFSFHSTIAEARAFARDATTLLPRLACGAVEVEAVWGSMGSARIQAALARARDARRSIVSNPRVLATGIDAPAVDLVVLAKSTKSYVATRQMMGRAARTAPGKDVAFVLLPLRTTAAEATTSGEMDDAALGDQGESMRFAIRAMLETDEDLQQRLSAALVESGRTGRRLAARGVLGPRFEAVGVPLALLEEQLGTVLLRLGDPWDRWLGRLEAYRAEHGDCVVPQRYVAADGARLGQWVGTQRRAYKGTQGGLSASQVARLEAVGMVWDALAAEWEASVARLEAYRAEHGDCVVPYGYVAADGARLGQWVSYQRQAYKGAKGGLSASQVARLEAVGMVWRISRFVEDSHMQSPEAEQRQETGNN